MEPAGTKIERLERRSFTLADAMIFIIAVGLALARSRPALEFMTEAARSDQRFYTLSGLVYLGHLLNVVFGNFLFVLLLAFLIVRLRRPRPLLRSVVCQPGFASCAALIVIVLGTAPLALYRPAGLDREVISFGIPIFLATATPLAWACLIATHRWNPEPSWIDRMGRVLGILSTLCMLTELVLRIVS